MSAIGDARDQLVAALKTVDGVRFHDGLGPNVDPPAVMVSPPRLSPDAYDSSVMTTAVFVVALAVAADERAMERLFELVGPVCTALGGVPDAVLTSADPGTFPAGGAELPAYLIDVEMSLG